MAPTNQSQVTNVATFQQPYPHAQLNGQPVRIMALGDVEGKSPAFLFITEDGTPQWESQKLFTITDQNCQPTVNSRTHSSAR